MLLSSWVGLPTFVSPQPITPEIRECLEACFQKNPEARPTATVLLQYRIFQEKEEDLECYAGEDDEEGSGGGNGSSMLNESSTMINLRAQMERAVVSRGGVGPDGMVKVKWNQPNGGGNQIPNRRGGSTNTSEAPDETVEALDRMIKQKDPPRKTGGYGGTQSDFDSGDESQSHMGQRSRQPSIGDDSSVTPRVDGNVPEGRISKNNPFATRASPMVKHAPPPPTIINNNSRAHDREWSAGSEREKSTSDQSGNSTPAAHFPAVPSPALSKQANNRPANANLFNNNNTPNTSNNPAQGMISPAAKDLALNKVNHSPLHLPDATGNPYNHNKSRNELINHPPTSASHMNPTPPTIITTPINNAVPAPNSISTSYNTYKSSDEESQDTEANEDNPARYLTAIRKKEKALRGVHQTPTNSTKVTKGISETISTTNSSGVFEKYTGSSRTPSPSKTTLDYSEEDSGLHFPYQHVQHSNNNTVSYSSRDINERGHMLEPMHGNGNGMERSNNQLLGQKKSSHSLNNNGSSASTSHTASFMGSRAQSLDTLPPAQHGNAVLPSNVHRNISSAHGSSRSHILTDHTHDSMISKSVVVPSSSNHSNSNFDGITHGDGALSKKSSMKQPTSVSNSRHLSPHTSERSHHATDSSRHTSERSHPLSARSRHEANQNTKETKRRNSDSSVNSTCSANTESERNSFSNEIAPDTLIDPWECAFCKKIEKFSNDYCNHCAKIRGKNLIAATHSISSNYPLTQSPTNVTHHHQQHRNISPSTHQRSINTSSTTNMTSNSSRNHMSANNNMTSLPSPNTNNYSYKVKY